MHAWLLGLSIMLTSVAANLEQYYSETYRPQFHFSPASNFMNDPNGLVYYKGEYHLFYQHNPFGDTWGHMSWGHAVSPDMIHWSHLPVALPEENGIMIFSGSAVVDWENSSGLCANSDAKDKSCLIAIYTGHGHDKQTQNIAYSNDRGRTWTKYSKNPVIDINYSDFRDPKVIWHAATRRWVMVTVLAKEHKVRFYGSKDLKRWDALSDFGPAGATGGVWECPDLFQLAVDGEPSKTKWVLKVDLNPGGVAGGSGGQYFVGDFNGTAFINDNPKDKTLWVDYGKDFYASMSWSDIPKSDKRRLWLAWMSNWQYAEKTPTHPWRGVQSIPRAVTLRKYADILKLAQTPVIELKKLRGQHYRFKNLEASTANAALAAQGVSGDTLEIVAEFALGSASEFGLKVRKGASEETVIGYDANNQQMFVDRTRSGNIGFDGNFPGKHAGPLTPEGKKVKFHIFVDRSSVEVFGNDGQIIITDRIFPDPGSTGLELYATGGRAQLVSMDVWKVKSAWKNPKGSKTADRSSQSSK